MIEQQGFDFMFLINPLLLNDGTKEYRENLNYYFNCKKRLFTQILQNNSAVAINIDDDFGKRLFNEIKNNRHIIVTFGKSSGADVKIISIKQNNQNIDLVLEHKKQIYNSTIGMIGGFQSYNVVAAASICIALGVEANLIFKSISYLKPARGRMEMISATHNNSMIIIDYAHTPEAFRYVLDSIKEIAKEKIITLFGCGGDRDKEKRKVMGELAKEFSDLVEWAEDVIFPWTGRSRIMIITTPPNEENPPHIDCSPEMFNTLQHKFRYVLQGNIDDLVFMSTEDIYLDKTVDKPFIMSGKWPHYMKNNSGTTKFTFAFGAPWDGDLEDDKYKNMLSKSHDSYSEYYKSFDGLSLPKNYQDYSPNPLIIFPLIAGAFGGYRIIKKAFRLAKQFESVICFEPNPNFRDCFFY